MKAVITREFKSYFHTPLGYVFLAAYYLFTGFFFYFYNLYQNSSDMRGLFDVLFTVSLFLIPILTMRLMSEEFRMKTDQLLYMSPVSGFSVIAGKFIAASCVYFLAISAVLLCAVVLTAFSQPEWPVIIGHFVGLLVLGEALISIGLFVSALTENQVIAAVGGFCVGFFLMLLDILAGSVSNTLLASALVHLSFQTRYRSFTLGILSFDSLFFFISTAALFVFITVCRFERRRLS